MGFGSPWHWLLIALIVFLLFGNRLPSVMRSLGEGIVEFKKGISEIKDESSKGRSDGNEKQDKT
jgi:sec-independent protein translocase protein TatA